MLVRIVNDNLLPPLNDVMSRLGVTSAGIDLMEPKADQKVVLLSSISSYAALILKQELLSIGGDLATPKETLLGKSEVSCLLIANLRQLEKLYVKLSMQSKSLQDIALAIKTSLHNFSKTNYVLKACDRKIEINRTLIMGVFNATPDSFSGDGLYGADSIDFKGLVVSKAKQMLEAGADFFDVGGESTKPFADKITTIDELNRVIPVVKVLHKEFPQVPISIDTYKSEVASAAIEAGACIVNDISGLVDKKMIDVVKDSGAAICIMHMLGNPQTMQISPSYEDVVNEVYDFLSAKIDMAISNGVRPEQIILDVGIGFGKRFKDNLALIKYHKTFKSLGFPLLLGVSRKSFIGTALNKDLTSERVLGTSIVNALGIQNGASILRVHDIEEAKQTINMTSAIIDFDK